MIRIYKDRDISKRNTFGMKVSCSCYVAYDTLEDLFKMDFQEFPAPVRCIGSGSNLLFTGDFKGTLLHSGIKFLREVGHGEDEVLVEAGAGAVFDDFVDWACSLGLWGAENLSLIPGEVGAAAVQNIGAYGVEAKDIIVRVNCFDRRTCDIVTFENSQCEYGYRSSFFKSEEARDRYIVTSVLFRLSSEPCPKLEYGNIRAALDGREANAPGDVRNAIIGIRRAKLPDPSETGSAGSFFKNPVISEEHFARIEREAQAESGPDCRVPHFAADGGVKVPAAWMIERCGLKGERLGGAAVYDKQPLVIVNLTGDASPEDILSLERKIIKAVRDKFGVELHPEVEHL